MQCSTLSAFYIVSWTEVTTETDNTVNE